MTHDRIAPMQFRSTTAALWYLFHLGRDIESSRCCAKQHLLRWFGIFAAPGENRARRNARDGIRGLLVYCSLLGDSADPWAGEVRLSETLSPLRLKDERQPSSSHAQAAEILVGKRIRPSSIGSQSLLTVLHRPNPSPAAPSRAPRLSSPPSPEE